MTSSDSFGKLEPLEILSLEKSKPGTIWTDPITSWSKGGGAPFVPHITCIHPTILSNHFLFNLPPIETKCVMLVI